MSKLVIPLVTALFVASCAAHPVTHRVETTYRDAVVSHGVTEIRVTHSQPEDASFDKVLRFDEPRTVVQSTCLDRNMGPGQCLAWRLGGRECTVMRGETSCHVWTRHGLATYAFDDSMSAVITIVNSDAQTKKIAGTLTMGQIRSIIGL